ncbi:hypothetical protein [Breoghania sp. L-A4]|uniref:hypothetical protein n=1 Tax=Breoghania sp. L-A4 TaxID=2304600 RepID=UPI000E35DE19|nr:hypothetical protein [Breoghania sp. L-A4]AXS39515.1 hypothetical protein D1F64_04935 [Breoghania sp. L-A4]
MIIAGHGGTKLDANGLPGYSRGSMASITCTQTFPDQLPDRRHSRFGFGSGETATLATASQYGYLLITRNPAAPAGWDLAPMWLGPAPAFPKASVSCDGTNIR